MAVAAPSRHRLTEGVGLSWKWGPRGVRMANGPSSPDFLHSKMLDRPPAEEVIQGLSTTSDKIRAPARAGYLRTEIRDRHLGIASTLANLANFVE